MKVLNKILKLFVICIYYSFSMIAGNSLLSLKYVRALSNNESKIDNNFKTAYMNFSVNLMKNCYKENDNLVFSPLSIMSSLLITLSGANGNTKREIQGLFNNNLDNYLIKNYNLYYSNLLIKDEKSKFGLSNSLWINKNNNIKLREEFKKNVSDLFSADIFNEDFKESFTINKINNWCSEKTNGLIDNFFDANLVNSETMLMILNAINFENIWENPYSKLKVSEQMFYGSDSNIVVEMLTSVENLYIQGESEVGFIKNYLGNKFAFVGLIPNNDIKISEYISGFNNQKFSNLINNVKNKDVMVSLPKFESDYQVSLKQVLKKLGVNDAFLKSTANFKNMIENNNIYIDDIIHKSKISVNENGTKAGSVIAVIFEKCSLINYDKINKIIFNRPFIYFIIDKSNEIPIFMGVINNL